MKDLVLRVETIGKCFFVVVVVLGFFLSFFFLGSYQVRG